MDKAARVGIRIADLLDRDVFAERLRINLEEKNRQFTKLYDAEALSFDDIFEEYYEYGQQIKQYVTDTSVILNDALDNGKRVLFEGAKGLCWISTKELIHCYFIKPVAGGVTIGSGVGPSKIDKVVGVCKAYTSRVGDGPFPTELFDEVGDRIREVGHEYGTTTGRPRRVGWFDSVVMRHSRRVSGITNLSLNSIDVLSGLDTVKICVPTTWMGNASTTTQQAWSNSNVANQSMKNYQAGQKTSQVSATWMSFQKMPQLCPPCR